MGDLLLRWVVLPAVVFAAGFAAGWNIHDWRDAAGQVKAERRVVAVVQRQGSINQAVAVQQQAAQDQVRYVTRTLIERVPIYVTPKADAGCSVPLGFVRLHDAAAAGSLPSVPDSAGPAADAPSGVALSAVAATVVANYGACNGDIDQLKGWQTWYAAQRAAFNAKQER